MDRINSFDESWEIQEEASALGFDWPDITGVIEKVKEEVAEIEDALRNGDTTQAQEELGDLLFATVNLSRFLNRHPNDALLAANVKFQRRFSQVREIAQAKNIDMKQCSLEKLDLIWDEVKRQEPNKKK